VGSLVEHVQKKELIKGLQQFIKFTRPSRYPGSKGHHNSLIWIKKKLQEIGCNEDSFSIESFDVDIEYGMRLYENDFNQKIKKHFKKKSVEYINGRKFTDSMQSTLTKFKGYKGQNLIWEKKGTSHSKEVIILAAHYDTIAFNKEKNKVTPEVLMPGADDNGTGVITLISLIELLNQLKLPKTVRIIFFDYQEMGFLGSYAYTKVHKKELERNVKAFVSVEMLGNDSKIFDLDKKLRNFKTYISLFKEKNHRKELALAKQFQQAGKKSFSNINFEVMANGNSSSGHIHFKKLNIPTLLLTQNLEKDYNHKRHHTSNDFVESINSKTFYLAFKYIAAAVISWTFDISR
jgi:Zn-dependent M28 family amino/carboxypeptidase